MSVEHNALERAFALIEQHVLDPSFYGELTLTVDRGRIVRHRLSAVVTRDELKRSVDGDRVPHVFSVEVEQERTA